jgi:hypothetical protein
MKNEQKLSEIPYVISLPNSVIQLPRGENLLNSKKKLFQFQFDNTFLDHKFDISVSYKLKKEEVEKEQNKDINQPSEPLYINDLFFDSLEIKVENNVVLKINSISSYDDIWDVPFIFDFEFWYEKFNSYRVKRIGEYETKKGITYITKETLEFNDLIFSESEKHKEYSKIIDEIRKEKLKQEFLPYKDKNLPFEIKERFNKIQKDLFFQFNTLFIPNRKYSSQHVDYSISAKYTYLECIKEGFNLIEHFKLILEIYQNELLTNFKNNLKGQFEEIPELTPSSIKKDFEQNCIEIIFNEIIGNSFHKLTNIDIIPAFKGNGTRYFQAGESIQSYLTKAAINLIETKNFNKDQYEKNIDFIKKWIGNEKFDIAKDIEIVNIGNRNIYTIELMDSKNRIINITDMGFGVSQLISVLLSISFYSPEKYQNKDKPIFYLEEPESNLHPNWQSLLMELIIEINQKFGIRFIIETHSEYMIRKLQNLVSKKIINNDEVKIYYFNSDKHVTKEEPKVKEMILREDGILSTSFGPGFFDEAVKLTVELLKIENYN